ncbi:hypothetical protein mRhiFer1_009954 [Rhinolophus ferrumequinum]|uniref:Uncharacterized protein n=1 Tax=Rhinolophus ferrumequinum TaxID=59479 RepID=A0A7J7YIT1_RHIFE|nr:hypothetical protein mRhiFer1_009954 [Rhinolophus ferrumequinum]
MNCSGQEAKLLDVLSASESRNIKFPAASLHWRAHSVGAVARAFPEGSPVPPSIPARGSLVHWANTEYANWLSHRGTTGRLGVAGRSRGRGANPTVVLRGRACQVSRDLCTSLARAAAPGAARARLVRTAPAWGGAGAGREGGGLGVLVT